VKEVFVTMFYDYNYSPTRFQRIEDFAKKVAERGADNCWLCNRPFSRREICLVTRAVADKLVIVSKCCVLETRADPTVRLVENFTALFAGRDDACGEVILQRGGSKSAGEHTALTHHQPLTIGIWRRHLDFYNSERLWLGIFPMRPRPAPSNFSSSMLASTPSIEGLLKRISALGLPLITCFSRGGGVLVYCFLSDSSPRRRRSVVRNWRHGRRCR
jgi:hypothetical protein